MTDPTDAPVLCRLEDHIGLIVMNRSDRLNCLGADLVAAILEGFDELESGGARVIILRAPPGARVWSAGHDIREIPLDGADPISWNVPFERLLRRVRDCPVPVIGLIEGGVYGGACDLAMTLDILVGCPSALFAITPVKLGLPYNPVGLSHFLGVLPLHVVKEMLFTANPLSASDAFRLGLLNRLVEPDELENTARAIAGDIASRAPLAVQVLKAELRNFTRGSALTPDTYERMQDLRQRAFMSADLKEGVRAFREKRPPRFTGE